jgi:hypothetical protein
MTPVVKAYGAEAGLRMADVSIQVFGGYGYIKEYGVEQLVRDVKIASIYEGTNSIQAIDLIGRKVPRKGGRDFMRLLSEIDAFAKANGDSPTLGADAKALVKANDALAGATMLFGSYQMKGDLAYPILLCKQYLEMFGDVMVAWTLLEQAALADTMVTAAVEGHPDRTFYANKVKTAQYFVRHILPRVHGTAARIMSKDTTALDIAL